MQEISHHEVTAPIGLDGPRYDGHLVSKLTIFVASKIKSLPIKKLIASRKRESIWRDGVWCDKNN